MTKAYEIIFYLSSFLYVLFSIYLLNTAKKNKVTNRILALFCIMHVCFIFRDIIFTFKGDIYEYIPVLSHIILDSSNFLIGPLLLLYTLTSLNKKFTFGSKLLLHIIPFFLDVFLRLNILIKHDSVRETVINVGYLLPHDLLHIRVALVDLAFISYAIYSFLILIRYQRSLKNYFSSIDKINLKWLQFIIGGLSGFQFLSFLKHTLFLHQQPYSNIVGLMMHIANLTFITLFVYKTLTEQEIKHEEDDGSKKEKYSKALLTNTQLEVYTNKILDFIKQNRPYLNPDFNIADLSKSIDIPVYHISQTLSRGLNLNFYQFVNNYRIEAFKKIIAEKKNSNITILEALYEAGFQSKSTFNRIFKQTTGITPTEYIKLSTI